MRRLVWIVHLVVILFTTGQVWTELLKVRGPAAGARPAATEAVPWSMELVALILLGAVWYTSFLAQRSPRKIAIAAVHTAWLGVFSWYGWFSRASPFRLHELTVPSVFSSTDPGWAITMHYVEAVAVFTLLVIVYSGIPLLVMFVPSMGPTAPAAGTSGWAELRILALSTFLFGIFFTRVIWQGLSPVITWEYGQAVQGCAFVGALVLVSTLASYGSWKAFALGLSEILLIPAAWLLR